MVLPFKGLLIWVDVTWKRACSKDWSCILSVCVFGIYIHECPFCYCWREGINDYWYCNILSYVFSNRMAGEYMVYAQKPGGFKDCFSSPYNIWRKWYPHLKIPLYFLTSSPSEFMRRRKCEVRRIVFPAYFCFRHFWRAGKAAWIPMGNSGC